MPHARTHARTHAHRLRYVRIGARTGYPWIDAAMTQLREEGWIHHLARHALACFLTRGDCFVSWESGRRLLHTIIY